MARSRSIAVIGSANTDLTTLFLAEGLPEKNSLFRANLYAALSTTRVGTQKSFPKHPEFADEWTRRAGKP